MMGHRLTPPKEDPTVTNQAVFVDVVKSVEDPEFMSLASLVRFDAKQRFYSVLPERLYCSSKKGFVLLGVVPEGEVNFRVCSPVWSHEEQLPSQMIQCDPEIVNDISSDEGILVWNRRNTLNVVNHLAGLRIALGADFVWVGCEESVADGCEVVEVLVGPFDFCVNPRKFFIRGHV